MTRSPCPCCGFLALTEPPPGTFAICPVCFWEDDNVQFADPDYAGGANSMSLNEARQSYATLGAVDAAHIRDVRSPLPEEHPG